MTVERISDNQGLARTDDADRYVVFVDLIIRAFDPEDAARLAGFDKPERAAPLLLQQPLIRKALVASAAARLEANALPLALAAVERILADKTTPAAVAAKLALGVLDRTGIGAKAENPSAPLTPLEDMTVEQLEAHIRQRGDKAMNITIPRVVAPDSDDEA